MLKRGSKSNTNISYATDTIWSYVFTLDKTDIFGCQLTSDAVLETLLVRYNSAGRI